jgi:hypothetical protein
MNALRMVAMSALAVGCWELGVGGQEPPLPDADALFAAVRENLLRAERETHMYTYRERRTDIHTNPFGKLGTGGVSLFEVYPSPTRRMTYRRLIEKDGKRIPSAQVAEQDRDYRVRVAEVQKEIAAQGPSDPRVVEAQAQGARERRQRALDDVVQTLRFQVKGRTTHKGAPVIAVTFAGKRDARPQTRQGRIAQSFTGTLYVDEQLKEVLALEATSTADISYGYGLVAKLGKGTVVTLVREPVEGGLWMPTRLTMKGRGRALMVRALVIDFAIDWFDYDRLPFESLAPFVDPRIHGQTRSRP